MNIKKISLYISLAIFMVFSLLFATSDSLAYWRIGIDDTNGISTATVNTGTWTQVYPWDAVTAYITGDQVTHNGVTYQAKKDNPTKEPGVTSGWTSEWTAL